MDQIFNNVACLLIFLSIYDALPQVYPACLFYGQILFLLYTTMRKLEQVFDAELGIMRLSIWDMCMSLYQYDLLFTSCERVA